MKIKRILVVLLSIIAITATSSTILAGEPTIDFGGRTFTRTEFIQTFRNGAKLGSEMVTAEVFFDHFFTAQNEGRIYNASPQQSTPAPQIDENVDKQETIAVLFEDVTLLTNEELLDLIKTAPSHYDTASINPLPSRHINTTELDEWINGYVELGGINAFELEVVRLINEVRLQHDLQPLMVSPQISMAARFFSQESAEDRHGNQFL